MADITHTDPVVTESTLKNFYDDIKPFLGCPAYLTSEGTSDYYSTDEKVIGRWVDGKPLYKKTITGLSLGGSWYNQYYYVLSNQTPLIANVDTIVYAYGVGGDNSTYKSVSPINICMNQNNTWSYVRFASDVIITLVLCYTKKTDSASTTIQEDPNEYSTDEKIIGKWIDGKPVYQKTIELIPTNTTASTSTPHNITNLKKVIKLDGMWYADNVGYSLTLPRSIPTNQNQDGYDLYVTATDVIIGGRAANPSMTGAIAILEYIKTTDI